MNHSFSYFDGIIENALFYGTAERIGNSEIFQVRHNDQDIRIGHVLSLFPQTEHGVPYDLNNDLTAFLAVQDFNNRQFAWLNDNDITNNTSTSLDDTELQFLHDHDTERQRARFLLGWKSMAGCLLWSAHQYYTATSHGGSGRLC